jgi:hypothetical protein
MMRSDVFTRYVFYGEGLPTPSKFIFDKEFEPVAVGKAPPTPKTVEHAKDDEGDGVCPLRTVLKSAVEWPKEQARLNKVLQHKGYPKMSHRDTTPMLPDAMVILDKILADAQAKDTRVATDRV